MRLRDLSSSVEHDTQKLYDQKNTQASKNAGQSMARSTFCRDSASFSRTCQPQLLRAHGREL